MKKSALIPLILVGATSSILLSGCVYRERVVVREPRPAPGEVIVENAPPPMETEEITIAPGPGYVWVPGAWVWRGHRWAWRRGHWVRPPRAGAVWVAPHYEEREGVHVWVEGNWRF